MTNFNKIAVCLAFAATPLLSSAKLTHVDTALGSQSALLDSSTNLQWLNLKKTEGLAYSSVSTNLTAGGTFDGWRYATVNEWRDLYQQFGFDTSTSKYVSEPSFSDALAIKSSAELLGNISKTGDPRDVVQGGFLADNSSSTGYLYIYYSYDACLIPSGECTPGPGLSSYGQYFTPPLPSYGEGDIPYGGSYLVRAAPVPEASTKVLAVVGLLGVFIARRRKA